MPHSSLRLERWVNQAPAAQDGPAAYQVVGGVTYPLAFNAYGLWEQSPEMDSETRIQTLRGAAGKTSHQEL